MKRLCWPLALIACPVPAFAQGQDDEPESGPRHTVSATVEHTDYTGAFGARTVGQLDYDLDFGDTKIVLTAAHGRREFETDRFDATRGAVTIYHDWSDAVQTRTSLSVSTDDPVFATLDVSQEFNLNVIPNVTLTAGGRYLRYFGDREGISWTAGASYYFRGGFLSYRYTGYDIDGLETTHGHRVSLRLNDGGGSRGFTQFWLGAGDAVQEEQALPDLFRGNFRTIAARRFQPLTDQIAASLSVTHNWYDAPVDYEGTGVRAGLSFSY